MIIEFAKTLFTPASVDVITRVSVPDAATWQDIDDALARQGRTGARRLARNAG